MGDRGLVLARPPRLRPAATADDPVPGDAQLDMSGRLVAHRGEHDVVRHDLKMDRTHASQPHTRVKGRRRRTTTKLEPIEKIAQRG
jgi:hypothetical protein